MNEGLTLLGISGFEPERQLAAVLAIASRSQGLGGTVRRILVNLEASEQAGSALARNVLAAHAQADQALKQMAGHKAKPGGRLKGCARVSRWMYNRFFRQILFRALPQTTKFPLINTMENIE